MSHLERACDAASLFREALGFGWIYGPLIPAHQWNKMCEEKVAQLVARLATPPAQPAVQEPVGEKEISAWAERHDIQGTPTDLRSMFEDAASFTTPPAPQPVPVKTYHDGKPWPVAPKPWVGLTDEDKLTVRRMPWETLGDLMDNTEAKLKEKNNGGSKPRESP